MTNTLERVEIQEPPIQQLNKRKSCLKRGCLTGIAGMLFFLILSTLLIWFATHPRTSKLTRVPGNFPSTVPVYDKDAIHEISLLSAKKRTRWIELASYLPKSIVSPILVTLDNAKYDIPVSKEESWSRFVTIMRQPTEDFRDIVYVEWTDLAADPTFILNYYQKELEKQRFSTHLNAEITPALLSFHKGDVDGVIAITDRPSKNGTDAMTMTINIPAAP